VRRFQLYLIESGTSICNRNRIMTGVRFLFRVTLRRHDLAAEVWHIKEPEKLPPVLSPEEVKRVLTMATSLKARAMLTLAYGCGLRAGEVVRLRAGNIDSEQMIIRIVQSKGGKDRHVMLPAEILELLRQWWKARPTASADASVAPEHRLLFPGRRDHRPLTTRQFGRLFKEAAKAAGLRKPVSLHSLRHYAESRIMQSYLWIAVAAGALSPPYSASPYSSQGITIAIGGLHEQLGWMLALRAAHAPGSIAALSRGF
jgi:integrase